MNNALAVARRCSCGNRIAQSIKEWIIQSIRGLPVSKVSGRGNRVVLVVGARWCYSPVGNCAAKDSAVGGGGTVVVSWRGLGGREGGRSRVVLVLINVAVRWFTSNSTGS